MDIPEHIEIRPDVMMGKPCLKGTRIPVYLILEKLAAGETLSLSRNTRSSQVTDSSSNRGPDSRTASNS
jgi:hypothetical protein